jgi:hypothetical protein
MSEKQFYSMIAEETKKKIKKKCNEPFESIPYQTGKANFDFWKKIDKDLDKVTIDASMNCENQFNEDFDSRSKKDLCILGVHDSLKSVRKK